MERFVARENIRRFRERIRTETDLNALETLKTLLAAEEAKLDALEGPKQDAMQSGARSPPSPDAIVHGRAEDP